MGQNDPPELVPQLDDGRTPAPIVRIGRPRPARVLVQAMLRAGRRDARPHAGDHPEPVLLTQTRAARTRERRPQSRPECCAGGVAEPGRHDAYDGVRRRIQSDRLTDGGAAPTEARLPERVTEDSN